jgi:hypothetical protein
MRRAPHPASLRLAGLKYNTREGTYEIKENGLLYAMDLEMTRLLKNYFKWCDPSHAPQRNMETWYWSLSREERARVHRTGALPRQGSDFLPDPDFEL